jgi:putative methionine-R-sulfoxide reductase with GAF domain
MEKEIVSEKKDKPVYDEQTLADLLEAAYVLQEHNRQLKQETELPVESQAQPESEKTIASPAPFPPTHALPEIAAAEVSEVSKDDYTPTLAQIVETQRQIQKRHLELNAAMSLVAERVTEIAGAGGAAIAIVDGKKVGYQAVAGIMTLPQGTEVPLDKALCAASLKTGHVIRCAHLNTEFLVDPKECNRRSIRSFIVVPVYHDGGIAGALELYYTHSDAFTEQDVHTCQLMAGLITEALARADEMSWKKSLANERAVMLEALEKLKPNLAALMGASSGQKSTVESADARTISSTAALSEPTSVCGKCGNQLVGEEQFCGKCGLPRSGDYEPPNMQSKVASLWHMQEAMRKKETADLEDGDAAELLASLMKKPISETFASSGVVADASPQSKNLQSTQVDGEQNAGPMVRLDYPSGPTITNSEGIAENEEETPTKTERIADWSSAAKARDFLERLANRPGALTRLWNTRRGDVYLAIAVVLVGCVICWGTWSDHSVGANGNQSTAAVHRKPAPDSDLSLFDRMLIGLGLAEAPEAPESNGNPNTQVWVDLQTALYYCPGADLYGKTPKGKFASQRDAQLDQFEPASRKACN